MLNYEFGMKSKGLMCYILSGKRKQICVPLVGLVNAELRIGYEEERSNVLHIDWQKETDLCTIGWALVIE